jgi:hypothetical protein
MDENAVPPKTCQENPARIDISRGEFLASGLGFSQALNLFRS